jgi:hypothetical protein
MCRRGQLQEQARLGVKCGGAILSTKSSVRWTLVLRSSASNGQPYGESYSGNFMDSHTKLHQIVEMIMEMVYASGRSSWSGIQRGI